jgi:hypothetical protein
MPLKGYNVLEWDCGIGMSHFSEGLLCVFMAVDLWMLELPWIINAGRCKQRGFVFGMGFRYKLPASKFATQYAVTWHNNRLCSVCHDDIAQRAVSVQFHEWEVRHNKNLFTCCLMFGRHTRARVSEEARENSGVSKAIFKYGL